MPSPWIPARKLHTACEKFPSGLLHWEGDKRPQRGGTPSADNKQTGRKWGTKLTLKNRVKHWGRESFPRITKEKKNVCANRQPGQCSAGTGGSWVALAGTLSSLQRWEQTPICHASLKS